MNSNFKKGISIFIIMAFLFNDTTAYGIITSRSIFRDKVLSPYCKADMDEENYYALLTGRWKPITELIKHLSLSAIIYKFKHISEFSETLRIPLVSKEKRMDDLKTVLERNRPSSDRERVIPQSERNNTHRQRNLHLEEYLKSGRVIDFTQMGRPMQLTLREGEIEAIEVPVLQGYEEIAIKIRRIYGLIQELSSEISNGTGIPLDLQRFLTDDYLDRNKINTHEALSGLFSIASTVKIRMVKDVYFIDVEEGQGIPAHAGRGLQYGEPRVWLGERQIQILSDVEIMQLILEESLHILKPEGRIGKDIFHNSSFLASIQAKLLSAEKSASESPDAFLSFSNLGGNGLVTVDIERTNQLVQDITEGHYEGSVVDVFYPMHEKGEATIKNKFSKALADSIKYYEQQQDAQAVEDLKSTHFYLVKFEEGYQRRPPQGFIWFDSPEHYLVFSKEGNKVYLAAEMIDILISKGADEVFIANLFLSMARWDKSYLRVGTGSDIMPAIQDYLLKDFKKIKQAEKDVHLLFTEGIPDREKELAQARLTELKHNNAELFYTSLGNLGFTYLRSLSPNIYPCLTAADLCIGRNYAYMREDAQVKAYIQILDKDLYVFRTVFNPIATTFSEWFLGVLKDNSSVHEGDTLLDATCGTGIVGVYGALNGAKSVLSIDINPNAVACASYNARKTGLTNMEAMESDLFDNIPEGRKFSLISFTPPFLDGPTTPGVWLEKAIYDPGFRLLRRFMQQVDDYLDSEGRIIISVTDKRRTKNEKSSNDLLLELAAQRNFDTVIIGRKEAHGEIYYIYQLTRREKLMDEQEIDNFTAIALNPDERTALFGIRELIKQGRSAYNVNEVRYRKIFMHLVQIYIEECHKAYIEHKDFHRTVKGEIALFIKHYCYAKDFSDQVIEDYFSALDMSPIMHREMERRFNDGEGIEVDGVMVANGNIEEVNMARDFYIGRLPRPYRSLTMKPIASDLWLGNLVGMMPLFEDYLNITSRDSEAREDKKVILHVLMVNGGAGTRNTLITISSDGKGETILDNGQTLMEQNIKQVKGLVSGLLEKKLYGEFFILVPCDNLNLPATYTGEAYRQDRGFYLYAKKTQVLGDIGLEQLKRWGPPFGQMFIRQDNTVKGFKEKPSIWGLLNRVLVNAIEESMETFGDVSTILAELATNMGLKGDELERELRFKYHDMPLQLLVLPMLVSKEVWDYVYENEEVEPNIKNLFLTIDEWREVWKTSREYLNRDKNTQRLIAGLTEKGKTDSFVNTFYFLLSRPVAERLYTLYSRPTEKNNGSFWARRLPPDKTPKMVAAIDWSNLILTPMTETEANWMEQYETRGINAFAEKKANDFIQQAGSLEEAYCRRFNIDHGQYVALQEKIKINAAKEGLLKTAFPSYENYEQTIIKYIEKAIRQELAKNFSKDITDQIKQDEGLKTEVLNAAELITTYTYNDWREIWNMAQEISRLAGGLTCVNFGPFWSDAGSAREIKRVQDIILSTDNLLDRAVYRAMFDLPIAHNGSYNVDSGKGKIEYPENYFRHRSTIYVPEGVTLKIGNNVRITNSDLLIIADPGETVVIPDDTAINHSYLNCKFAGNKPGDFIYNYILTEGTLEFKGGQLFSTTHANEGNLSAMIPIDATPLTWGNTEIAGGYKLNKLFRSFPGQEKDAPVIVNRRRTYQASRVLNNKLKIAWERSQTQDLEYLHGRILIDIIELLKRDRIINQGAGYIATFLLKGGEEAGCHPVVLQETFERIGEHYGCFSAPSRPIGKEGVLKRKGLLGLQHSLVTMSQNPRYTEDFLRQGSEALLRQDVRALESWISDANTIDPDEKGHRTLACALNSLKKTGQQVMTYRISSRAEIIRDFVRGREGEELDMAEAEQIASELLNGQDPYKADEQDFFRAIVIGDINPYLAHPGSLRHSLLKHLENGGVLSPVIERAIEDYRIDREDAVRIINVFRCPNAEEDLFHELAQISHSDLEFFEGEIMQRMYRYSILLGKEVRKALEVYGRPISVTIDGYGQTGKSTVTKDIADALDFSRLPGGEISRLITYNILREIPEPLESADQSKILEIARNTLGDLKFKKIGNRVALYYKDSNTAFVDDQAFLDNQLREERVSKNTATVVMTNHEVRNLLIRSLLDLIKQANDLGSSVVIDGRLEGTEIENQADIRVCLDTSYSAIARSNMHTAIKEKGLLATYTARTKKSEQSFGESIRLKGKIGVEEELEMSFLREVWSTTKKRDIKDKTGALSRESGILTISSIPMDKIGRRLSVQDVREAIFIEIITKLGGQREILDADVTSHVEPIDMGDMVTSADAVRSTN